MAVGRFAPTPTAPLHLGNLRTALVAWLAARSVGSAFLMRIEDLDPAACHADVEERQLDDLSALGIDWDEPVVRQSERRPAHDEAVAALVRAGRTYPCWCTRREIREAAAAPHEDLPEGAYPGTCRTLSAAERSERERTRRPPALRLRAEGARIAFDDRLAGPVEGVVDDFVIRRVDGIPAYNLAVVVDDAAAGVEEVVRGDDLLPSTPRQILVSRLLGLDQPSHLHVPLVVGPDGERLAKRHGDLSLAAAADAGLAPPDVLALLAQSLGLVEPGIEVTAAELVARFDLDLVPRTRWAVPARLSARSHP